MRGQPGALFSMGSATVPHFFSHSEGIDFPSMQSLQSLPIKLHCFIFQIGDLM